MPVRKASPVSLAIVGHVGEIPVVAIGVVVAAAGERGTLKTVKGEPL